MGDGSPLSTTDVIGGRATRFYVVDERSEFAIDLASYGYGTLGSSWTYEVTDSREEDVPYSATFLVEARQEFPDSNGQQVIRVIATRSDDNSWGQTLYILDDFSEGLFQVGGVNPLISEEQFPGEYFNTSIASTPAGASVAPLLLKEFVPGVTLAWDYNNSNFNDVDNSVTHTLSSYTLPGDCEPTTAIKVTSNFTSVIELTREVFILNIPFSVTLDVNVTSSVEDFYIDGVDLAKKVVSVDAVPQDSAYSAYAEYIDVTLELQSFTTVD